MEYDRKEIRETGKDFLKISEFNITIRQDFVFKMIDCREDCHNYEEILEEYTHLEKEVYQHIEPIAYIRFGNLDKELIIPEWKAYPKVIYTLMTLGSKAAGFSQEHFNEGNYLAGFIIDAMLDDYLFQMFDEIALIIKEECESRRFGIKKRLEAPNDIPMIAQKIILEEMKKFEDLKIGITTGYMYKPIKTLSNILLLTEEECFNIKHNCTTCHAVNCKMRS